MAGVGVWRGVWVEWGGVDAGVGEGGGGVEELGGYVDPEECCPGGLGGDIHKVSGRGGLAG